jgi:uncharacterized protein (DUF2236 family)
MELAEPGLRTVWEHTTFRVNPIRRLRRTGLATMVTVYVYAEPPLEINKEIFLLHPFQARWETKPQKIDRPLK